MDKDMINKLIDIAFSNIHRAYAPYSNFKVSAALLMESGEIYTGVNIENSAYPVTVCAERTAIFKAISEGEKKIKAICVIGGKGGNVTDYAYPCGSCRQVMREFSDPKEMYVIIAKSKEEYIIKTLEELLPLSFGPEDLA